jgi:Centromere DNA-binding protein complex CBF3 subunit, domain 2
MAFVDGELVSNDKLLLFVDTQIIGRTASTKRIRTNEAGDTVTPTISTATVELEVSAIISLWNFQYSSPSCPVKEAPVRSEALKILLKTNQSKEASRKKNQFEDRALGTLLDGYNSDQMAKVVRFGWDGWQDPNTKRVIPATIESHLRTSVDFLFSHSMLLRGENIRMAQLADLFTIELENEGPTPCQILFLIINNGKTN